MKFNFVYVRINTDGNKFVAENISNLMYLFEFTEAERIIAFDLTCFCQLCPFEFVKTGLYQLTINRFSWC